MPFSTPSLLLIAFLFNVDETLVTVKHYLVVLALLVILRFHSLIF
jgi:hypothetical protein